MYSIPKKVYKNFAYIVSYPLKIRRMAGSWIILNFHQISDKFIYGIHYKGTWTHTNNFKTTINKICNKYNIISLENGINIVKNGLLKKNTYFSITFDDGDASLKNGIVCFLEKKNIPATLFINSAYLDDNYISWVRALVG